MGMLQKQEVVFLTCSDHLRLKLLLDPKRGLIANAAKPADL